MGSEGDKMKRTEEEIMKNLRENGKSKREGRTKHRVKMREQIRTTKGRS